jgi:hypothetical protein
VAHTGQQDLVVLVAVLRVFVGADVRRCCEGRGSLMIPMKK